MADLVPVLRSLLSPDNALRNQAEAHYAEKVKQSPGDVAKHLLEVLASHREATDAALRYVFQCCVLPFAFISFPSPCFPPLSPSHVHSVVRPLLHSIPGCTLIDDCLPVVLIVVQ